MPYQVDRFNGTFLISVDDGTIDTTTDLRFVGKNYAGYGEVQNENFLHLMENFANTSPPPKVVTGQIWFDSANKKLKFYDGSQFRTASGAAAQNTAPSGLTTGDFWFDTSADQLYAWNGTEYILIGPENAPDTGTSALVSQVVKDTTGTNHSIAKLVSGGDTILIVSKDSFTLNSSINPITGFTVIKKGITLVNTNSSTGVTTSEHIYWGTASNALKLGNYSADDFVRVSSPALPPGAKFDDSGYTVGDAFDLKVYIENGDEPTLYNQGDNGVIKIKIRVDSSDIRETTLFTSSGIIPGSGSVFTLGNSSTKWSAIYGDALYGNVTGNVTGNTTGIHTGTVRAADNSTIVDANTKTVTATFSGLLNGNVVGDLIGTANNALSLNGLTGDTAATPTSIVVRDSSGNITANRFNGTTDKADRIKIDNSATDTDPNYRTAKTTVAATSVAARDSSGDLWANIFHGTATAAQYADLAEKYLADKEYEPGTVVVIGGDAEVTASSWGQRAIGVVSTNPAFMMNKDLEGGTYIALKGRVPVKVIGAVTKGQRLIAADNGRAVAAVPHANDVFAIALESNSDTSEKTIEAVIL